MYKKISKEKLLLLPFLTLLTSGCFTCKQPAQMPADNGHFAVKRDTFTLFDPSRDRKVPIAQYLPETKRPLLNQQLIIVNHGYGQNKADSYLNYSYLTEHWASKGYFVVSVQHELPTDSLIPSAEIPKSGGQDYYP